MDVLQRQAQRWCRTFPAQEGHELLPDTTRPTHLSKMLRQHGSAPRSGWRPTLQGSQALDEVTLPYELRGQGVLDMWTRSTWSHLYPCELTIGVLRCHQHATPLWHPFADVAPMTTRNDGDTIKKSPVTLYLPIKAIQRISVTLYFVSM